MASAIVGAPDFFNSYSDDLALLIFLGWYSLLRLKRNQAVITKEAIVILIYIAFRMMYLLLFSSIKGYGVINYIFPIKNWFVLLLAFLCGLETRCSFAAIKDFMVKYMRFLILAYALLQLLSVAMNSDFMHLGGGISRFPFIRYRMGIGNYLLIFFYYFITMNFIRNETRGRVFAFDMAIFVVGFLLCQAKNVLFGILLINLIIALSVRNRMGRHRFFYIIFAIPALLSLIAFTLLIMVRGNLVETALSVARRLLLLDYVKTHFLGYPLMGYPIPAFSFAGAIPADIVSNFMNFDFQKTIFPSDFPALFLLSEEGILGVAFLFVLWCLVIKKNSIDGLDMLLIQLAAFLVFPAYAFIALSSSVVFYLLGVASSPRRIEGCRPIVG